jgi:hypothetical protein
LSSRQKVESFFSDLSCGPKDFGDLPFNKKLKMQPESQMPWFEFFVPDFPREEILSEVQALKPLFVEHRETEAHFGWKSLCLHGISAQKTMCYFDYGYSSKDVAYKWTEIAHLCPRTVNYFKNNFPSDHYERIRFMLVEPGGYICPHKDREEKSLGPLSIALNVPQNCRFGLENHGIVPLQPGGFYLLDLSNKHSVWNQSNEDRYHITVEMHNGSKFYQYLNILLKNYEKKHPIRKLFNKNYRLVRDEIRSHL